MKTKTFSVLLFSPLVFQQFFQQLFDVNGGKSLGYGTAADSSNSA